METTIETRIAKLVDLIETKYLSTHKQYRPMDFAQKTQYFTLDVISDLAFGHPLGYLDQDDDVYDYIKITKASIPAMMILSNMPVLANIMQSRFLRSLLPKDTDKIGFGAFIGSVPNSLSPVRTLGGGCTDAEPLFSSTALPRKLWQPASRPTTLRSRTCLAHSSGTV
jgi:hypothetical protein